MIQLSFDGKSAQAASGENLLTCAINAGVAIPHLCHHQQDSEATNNKQSCGLCYVEIKDASGQRKTVKACETQVTQTIEVITHSAALSKIRQASLKSLLSDHFADCEAPCQQACPAGVDVQSYLYQIAQGNHSEAVKIIKDTLPLPLSIGRVCPAFCESACRRGELDDPIAIRQLKRHSADIDLQGDSYVPERQAPTGKKIAIVGSGPAGISAGFFLSNAGHEVTVYESMPQAGGWLRYGIPEYRLPKAILDQEIALLCRNGMNIQTNTSLGSDIHLKDLIHDFDAVCLAIGAQKAVPMNYPGVDLQGCYLGVDYLKDHCTEKRYTTGRKVAVIGGGNTAIDCARTALREGAEVTLVYRRTRDEMPAEDYEIEEAEHEGVRFYFLTNPIENHSDNAGRVGSVTFEKMALGEPDASGRRSPRATGETFTEDFDTVIPAVSQTPDMSFLEDPDGQLSVGEIALTRWNTFSGCEYTMSSGIEKLFVLGDSRTGPATAVAAVADGKKAATAIQKQLDGGLSCELNPKPFNSEKRSPAPLDLSHFPNKVNQPRARMPELALDARRSFDEIELGFSEELALAEAARCLECGCQANTDCQLRDYASEYRVEGKEITGNEHRAFVQDKSSPFINFDPNRCIGCGSCVAMCHQQSGHDVISFERDSYLALPQGENQMRRNAPRVGFNATMADSQCVQCGNCVQVCPTGALTYARDKSQGRKLELKETSTICTYCGVGCRVKLQVDPETNKIIQVNGDSDSPVNEGMLCVKGRFGFDFINSTERLTTPLIRRNGELTPASWEEAFGYIGDKLKQIKQTHGSNAIAGLASAKATNEDNYLFQKLLRSVIGTNNIDHCARLCHSSTVSGLQDALGSGAMTNDIPSIKASDLIFILGSDTEAAHPIIASKIKQAVKQHGARLVVADPKRVSIADSAELYLCQRPGTDVMLLNAIMQQIIINEWHDLDYINARTEGFAALYDEVMKPDYSLQNAALITGLEQAEIQQLAKLIGTAKKTAIYYAMGITQHTCGHDNVTAIANLQLLCGNLGVAGAGINPLRGQSNVQGACDMGALPNYFTGYQQVTDPQIRQRVSQAWGVAELPATIGLAATEMMHALAHGQLKALYVMGENPVLSDPDQAHVLKGLEAAELLVVQDIFMTETAQLADVVLPAASFAEKQGHFTNTERRVQQLQAALASPGQARLDWQIITEIAKQLGADWDYQDERQIWSEITSVTPQYRGISWERVAAGSVGGQQGIQWPCPSEDHPGTPIMHTEQFTRGKAVMTPVNYRLPAEMPCEEYPFILSTGRLLEQFHTGTLTRKTDGLNQLGSPRVMISAFDADQLGIHNGDMLSLTTRRGEISIPAFVSKRAQAGVLFLPFHFAEAAANKLTNNVLDPVAKIPEFKICAVKVTKLELAEA